MRKVLHVWQSYYPWEVRVGKINRALSKAGFEVHVACRGKRGEKNLDTYESTFVHRLGSGLTSKSTIPFPRNPFWIFFLKKLIKDLRPELIIVRDLPLALDCGKLAKAYSIPVIMDMAEHYPEAMRSWDKYQRNWFLRKLVFDVKVPDRLENKALQLMSGVWVVCEEQKERLIREYRYPKEQIEVVMNTPENVPEASQSNESSNKPGHTFGYHGILCEDRELEVILKGFNLYCEQNKNAKLIIAGGGESEQKLRGMAEQLKNGAQITFTGRYDPSQLPQMYSEIDFGIVALRKNKFTENTLANKFFDYPARMKPIIYPKIAPLVRVMEHMNCGVGFDPGSAESVCQAMQILADSDRGILAKNGYSAVLDRFNWSVDSKKAISFIERLYKSR